jgi:transcriptional regulator with XRE-family HTH domain
MSDNTLASIEYGGRPSQPIIEKIAEFLQRPVSELDPTGIALKRRTGPKQKAQELPADGAAAELLEQLVVLHAEFNRAHGDAVTALRTNDIQALTAARVRQAEILAQQGGLINAYVSASGSEATADAGPRPG